VERCEAFNSSQTVNQLVTVAGRKKLAFLGEVIRKAQYAGIRVPEVLDYGCGDGFIASFMYQTGCRVHAVDRNTSAVTSARVAHAATQVEFFTTEEWRAKRGTQKYDIVTCLEVLQYIIDVERLVADFACRLNEGGILMLSAPNAMGPYCLLRRLIWLLRRGFWEPVISKVGNPSVARRGRAPDYHFRSLQLRRIRSTLEASGFRIVRLGHSDFLIAPVFSAGLSMFLNPERAVFRELDRLDGRLADVLPSAVVSGWFLECSITHG
jgi:SAM-dependent methyltransferase